MTKPKFTPGEWILTRHPNHDHERWGELYEIHTSEDNDLVGQMFSKADGQLFLASRDMYLALEKLVMSDIWSKAGKWGFGRPDAWDEGIDALKKARGEE